MKDLIIRFGLSDAAKELQKENEKKESKELYGNLNYEIYKSLADRLAKRIEDLGNKYQFMKGIKATRGPFLFGTNNPIDYHFFHYHGINEYEKKTKKGEATKLVKIDKDGILFLLWIHVGKWNGREDLPRAHIGKLSIRMGYMGPKAEVIRKEISKIIEEEKEEFERNTWFKCGLCGSLWGSPYHFISDKGENCIHKWVRISKDEYTELGTKWFQDEWNVFLESQSNEKKKENP